MCQGFKKGYDKGKIKGLVRVRCYKEVMTHYIYWNRKLETYYDSSFKSIKCQLQTLCYLIVWF